MKNVVKARSINEGEPAQLQGNVAGMIELSGSALDAVAGGWGNKDEDEHEREREREHEHEDEDEHKRKHDRD
jgi:hypothetical protein